MIVYFFIITLAIGIYEELLCRGLLFNSFKIYFGNTKKGVYLSAIFSSLIVLIYFTAVNLVKIGEIQTITRENFESKIKIFLQILQFRVSNLWHLRKKESN